MTLLLEILVNHIVPIFFAAGIGAAFGRVFNPDLTTISRIAFYVFSPCLVFSSLTSTRVSGDELWRLTAFTVAAVAASGLLALGIGYLLRLRRSLIVALMLSTMFVNGGNYGLPLTLFAFGDAVLARAIIYFVVSGILVYSVGVFVASTGAGQVGPSLLGVFKTPAVYAIGLAGLVVGFGWRLPPPLSRPIDLLAQAAIPVMLLLLGLQFSRARFAGRLSWVGLVAVLRLVVAPLVAFGLATLLQLSGPARKAAILEASMPTAVIATLLAQEFDAEPTLVAGAVMATTLLSPLTLTPLIAILQQ